MATKITLRSRPISGGRRSLYLDYYPPVREPRTMKMKRKVSMGMYIYEKPKTLNEKEHNKSIMELAETIRGLRLKSILHEDFSFLDKGKLKGDFLQFFKEQTIGRNNVWESSLNHFRIFVQGKCTYEQITVDLCNRFRSYLLSAPNKNNPSKSISQNTASVYYKKFMSTLYTADSKNLLADDIIKHLEVIKSKPAHIEFLLPSELYKLSRTPCAYKVLKRASLFSCLTGLRRSDILTLQGEKIVPNISETGYSMRIRTEKTENEATLPLSEEALELCGSPTEGLVFDGLTKSMCDKPLKAWLKSAGITKHITFHCFRHTFAVLQLAGGTDIYTLKYLMTHKSIHSTEVYLDILESTKIKSTGRIKIYRDPDLMAA